MVFVRQLQQFGLAKDIDVITLHANVGSDVLARMRKLGIKTVPADPVASVRNPYFKHSLIKLRVFQLLDYKEVLYADADAIPLRDLAPLFSMLPENARVAAPVAYWLTPKVYTSALMLVRPSDRNWDRLARHFENAYANDMYDMDILNCEFQEEIHSLPNEVFCIDSEWEDRHRPGHFEDSLAALEKLSVVHFTALGKPWMFSMEEHHNLAPTAYPQFFELRRKWLDCQAEILR
jgi:alpha-N-acetylglucosamine transferase